MNERLNEMMDLLDGEIDNAFEEVVYDLGLDQSLDFFHYVKCSNVLHNRVKERLDDNIHSFILCLEADIDMTNRKEVI